MKTAIGIFVVSSAMLATSVASADETRVAGRVVSTQGVVKVRHAHAGDAEDVEVAAGDEVHEADVLHTAEGSGVRLLMADKSVLDLGERSRISLASYSFSRKIGRSASVKLWIGRMWARVATSVGDSKRFEVDTPNAVAGVRGTRFFVGVSPSGESQVIVDGGSVEVGSRKGGTSRLLGALERGIISPEGDISFDAVSAEEVASLWRQLSPQPRFAQSELRTLRQRAGVPVDTTPAPPLTTDGGDIGEAGDLGGGMPPVNLDPGVPLSGSDGVRIRGRIEIQD